MPKFERKRAVTLPTLKMVIDKPIYVTIEEIVFKDTKDRETGKTAVDKNGNPKQLPVAKVIDLETGEMLELVCGAALIAQLQEEYSQDDVKGKSFEIVKHNKKTGKDYHTYTIYEIEPNEAQTQE